MFYHMFLYTMVNTTTLMRWDCIHRMYRKPLPMWWWNVHQQTGCMWWISWLLGWDRRNPGMWWVVHLGTGYQLRGGGAAKWGNHGSETVCTPPPPRSRQGKSLCAPPPPPLLKGGHFDPPPSVWLKLQASVLKLTQHFLCYPRQHGYNCLRPPPLFVGVKLDLPSTIL